MSERAEQGGADVAANDHDDACPYGEKLTLDNVHKSWGLGWVCLGCARPVRITVEHLR